MSVRVVPNLPEWFQQGNLFEIDVAEKGTRFDAETLNILTICLGVMYGVNGANKALKVMSQDNFELPKSSNIFSNITALFSGLSHENKIIQLEKYLKDLTETPEINNSKQLIFFLELNHLYEIN